MIFSNPRPYAADVTPSYLHKVPDRPLRAAGVPVDDVWDLVNSRHQYKAAIPVLLDWLQNLDRRMSENEPGRLREGIVRALTVPAAKRIAAPALIAEFRKSSNAVDSATHWAIGNALGVVADDSFFDEIEELVRDRGHGRARQAIVLRLGRSRDPRAVSLLIALLDDDEVAAHAVSALGTLKDSTARPALEPMLNHPNALVRREAKKALAKL